ncbi:MAG: hypothetical protein LIO58_00480 [Oscillospiraceae bacterium]|nr:hypothetical protein [Oscillospiraceae bacterium]
MSRKQVILGVILMFAGVALPMGGLASVYALCQRSVSTLLQEQVTLKAQFDAVLIGNLPLAIWIIVGFALMIVLHIAVVRFGESTIDAGPVCWRTAMKIAFADFLLIAFLIPIMLLYLESDWSGLTGRQMSALITIVAAALLYGLYRSLKVKFSIIGIFTAIMFVFLGLLTPIVFDAIFEQGNCFRNSYLHLLDYASIDKEDAYVLRTGYVQQGSGNYLLDYQVTRQYKPYDIDGARIYTNMALSTDRVYTVYCLKHTGYVVSFASDGSEAELPMEQASKMPENAHTVIGFYSRGYLSFHNEWTDAQYKNEQISLQWQYDMEDYGLYDKDEYMLNLSLPTETPELRVTFGNPYQTKAATLTFYPEENYVYVFNTAFYIGKYRDQYWRNPYTAQRITREQYDRFVSRIEEDLAQQGAQYPIGSIHIPSPGNLTVHNSSEYYLDDRIYQLLLQDFPAFDTRTVMADVVLYRTAYSNKAFYRFQVSNFVYYVSTTYTPMLYRLEIDTLCAIHANNSYDQNTLGVNYSGEQRTISGTISFEDNAFLLTLSSDNDADWIDELGIAQQVELYQCVHSDQFSIADYIGQKVQVYGNVYQYSLDAIDYLFFEVVDIVNSDMGIPDPL